MWRSDFDLKEDNNYQSYNNQIPTLPAYKAPNPNSLVDLNFNRRVQEEKAYVCFGQGLNSLGLPLVISPAKAHLEHVLQLHKVRYKIVDPATVEAAVSDQRPIRRELYSGVDDENLSFLVRKPAPRGWNSRR